MKLLQLWFVLMALGVCHQQFGVVVADAATTSDPSAAQMSTFGMIRRVLWGSPDSSIKRDRQPILLIGAGLPRTGTMSFITALERLGLYSYHVKRMLETPGHVDLWHQFVVQDELSLADVMDRVQNDGFNATYGLLAVYYKELMEQYPDARVVLTVRSEDDPGAAWAKSVSSTMSNVPALMSQVPFGWFTKMKRWVAVLRRMLPTFTSTDRSTGLPLTSRLPYDYNDWVAEVKEHVPAERLLVFAAKDGWKPLCDFLSPLSLEIEQRCREVLESGEPYPRVNETKRFKRLFVVLRTITALTYAAPVLAVVALLARWMPRRGLLPEAKAKLE